MELRRLRYFLVTAEELHVARAAERLGIAQPALSQQLKVLESALGVRLFERAGRGIRLSEVGASFVPEARATVLQAERAMQVAQAAARGELGQLEIGYVASAMLEEELPALISGYRVRHPGVQLRLHRLPVQAQLEGLAARSLDLGFVRGVGAPAGHLRGQVMSRSELVLALPATHRLAGQAEIALAQLELDPFVVLQDGVQPGYFALRTEALCAAAGFAPQVTLRIGELVSLVGLVAAGMGVSLVPAAIAKIGGAGVVFRRLAGAPQRFELLLLRHRDNRSAAVARLLEMATAMAPDAGG